MTSVIGSDRYAYRPTIAYSAPAAHSRAEDPAETNAAKSPTITGMKSIREDLQTLMLTLQPLARSPPDKDLSSEDNHIPAILRDAPSHLRSWLMDLSSQEHDKIYMTVVNEEDKLWVEEHYEEVVKAMPVQLELWENNIILQIPSQIHQFAGRVIKEVMDKYKSGTHSITIMETADVPLLDKHWKQCDIQITDLGPLAEGTSPALQKAYSYPTVVVEVGFSESAADVDFDIVQALCLMEGKLWLGIALKISKGQNPVLTVTIFVFAPGLMSEDKVAEARLKPGRVYGRHEGHWVPAIYQDHRRYNNFLAIGAKTIEEDGKWGKPAYYCLQDDSWEITRDVHDHEQDIIIKEGYFKRVSTDFEAPALTIPAKKLWENLLKCKEVTGLFKGDMDLIK
ncbi:uncharacterized protein EV420DRAFT_1653798 [Desarmillaria tabescens]|uniref:Uncharacterized protein n=1 Tax=Armillaria tabescens TaxID=1929756 RepID=A0AA39J281_ARMTA|nr:uncharacterized protein EV420DRAFT_1653798 [Desarmillaria tabescens]KAK0434753.1 hypothetical protein EV420DRAFT_1653798 [Desarmillaria tabescens]